MDQNEALNQIKYIKETMEKAGHSFFFSPWQWIEWGILVVIGCIATLFLNLDSNILKLIWLVVFIIGGTLETWLWLKGSKNRGIDPFTPFAVKIWGILFMFILLGIILTFIFLHVNLPLYIPGIWLILTASCLLSLTLFGLRKELIVFGILLYIAGLLSISIFVEYSVLLAMIFFGINGTLLGIYQLLTKQN